MEAGERIACVFAEKEADPFDRVLLQPGELPAPFRVRQAVDGHVALERAVVLVPFPVCLQVVYLAHFMRSFI
ncbi:hypothetical protein [uncultured Duncaniella sp.]|uniref:hypothetical protein n=1 Tax=uncultured Duncaniella sp. TaxID=2768039 RepID=UPI0025A9461D|nr:hypothetical protein [uncultured Duncaniella sp.]